VLAFSALVTGSLGRSDDPPVTSEDTTTVPTVATTPSTTAPATPPAELRSIAADQAFVCVAGAPRTTTVVATVGSAMVVETVRLLATLTASPAITVPARTMERVGPATYQATAGPFTTPGSYRLEVEVVTASGQRVRAAADKPLEVRTQCSVD